MIKRTSRWIDERLGVGRFAREVLNKVFPDHWSFMLGEIALYCFVILVLTGTFLAFFFEPSLEKVTYTGEYDLLNGVEVSAAYRSVLHLSFEVRAGLVMRQIHHWAANVFLVTIVLHLCRVFFTGAFRKPREINWIIGVTLLLLALLNGFTGYSLPDDLLSGTGLRIAYSIALSIPVVGTWIAFLVFGGEFPSEQIISRLFVAHVYVIPVLIGGLLAAHLAILWRQKHTQFPGPGRTETNVVGSKLWPTYAAKSIGLFCAVLAVLGALGGLVQINPVWLFGPFEPSGVTSPVQPDWYLGWLEGALRLFPAWETRAFGFTIANPFYPGVLLPGVTFMLLYLWPFIEAKFSPTDAIDHQLLDRPRDRPMRTALGAATIAFYAILFFAGSNDVIARSLDIPVETVTLIFRILIFVLPVITGFIIFRVMDALKRTDAEGVLHLKVKELIRR